MKLFTLILLMTVSTASYAAIPKTEAITSCFTAAEQGKAQMNVIIIKDNSPAKDLADLFENISYLNYFGIGIQNINSHNLAADPDATAGTDIKPLLKPVTMVTLQKFRNLTESDRKQALDTLLTVIATNPLVQNITCSFIAGS